MHVSYAASLQDVSFEEGMWEARAFAFTKLLLSLKSHGRLRGQTIAFVNSAETAEALCAFVSSRGRHIIWCVCVCACACESVCDN